KQDKIRAQLNKTATDAETMAKKQGLDKAASQYGAQVVQSNMVTRNDALPGIGPQPSLMDAVFSSTDKAGPQSARTQQSTVVFEVAKVEPARTPSFEEVKDRVTNEFKAQ